MGWDVCEASDAAREIFDTADQVLGFSLSRLCFEGPEDELRRTEIQQPAILTTSVALLRALEEQLEPNAGFVAGHSLGEYTALVASGALGFEDAVRTVHARGRFMQEAVPNGRGAMAALIGCPPEDAERACRIVATETGHVVAPANYNAPKQTVIAGHAAAVELACSRARQNGAIRAVPLPVSAPFHCDLMTPAAEKLGLELSSVRFREACPPVVTNVEATPNSDARRMPELLKRQVTAPVRFVDMVEWMSGRGVNRMLEIGPGRVLTGLIRCIDANLARRNFSKLSELEDAARFATAA
jgi:[acyl-carrier-protein] S-malonyltransferase